MASNYFTVLRTLHVHQLMRMVHCRMARCRRYSQKLRFYLFPWLFESFGTGCGIGRGVRVEGRTRVHIGSRVAISDAVRFVGNGQISIGNRTAINASTIICGQKSVSIGDDCMIAPYVYILDTDHKRPGDTTCTDDLGYVNATVNIGNSVWIGTHCVILKGVTIGDRAVVGANSVVNSDVAPGEIVVGSPARTVRNRLSDAA